MGRPRKEFRYLKNLDVARDFGFRHMIHLRFLSNGKAVPYELSVEISVNRPKVAPLLRYPESSILEQLRSLRRIHFAPSDCEVISKKMREFMFYAP